MPTWSQQSYNFLEGAFVVVEFKCEALAGSVNQTTCAIDLSSTIAEDSIQMNKKSVNFIYQMPLLYSARFLSVWERLDRLFLDFCRCNRRQISFFIFGTVRLIAWQTALFFQ